MSCPHTRARQLAEQQAALLALAHDLRQRLRQPAPHQPASPPAPTTPGPNPLFD